MPNGQKLDLDQNTLQQKHLVYVAQRDSLAVHGLDLSLLKPAGGKPLTLAQYVYGLAGVALVSFITGALFALYNLVALRRSMA